jgi:sulfur-oxidizing protein SoxZ
VLSVGTATEPIRIRARLSGDVAEVRALISHPMETGLRVDAAGQVVPAHYVTEVIASVGARVVFTTQMSIAVSRDPLIAFRFRGASAGQTLRVAWTDNRGHTRADEVAIV